MLPLRRLAMVQAPRLLVRAPVAAPSLVRSLHSAPLRFSPIPTNSDNMHNTSSTTTAGKGLNEAGGKNDNAPNAHNTTKSTSNSGTAGGSKPESSSDHKYGPGAGAQEDPIAEVKEKVKRTAKKAKSAVQAMGEDASDNVHYGADKAKVGMENVKAEVKNTVRKAKTSVKQTARDLDNGTTGYSTGAASQTGVDTEALKAKAKDAAATAKETASSVLSSVKQAASSAVSSLKDATAGATAVASEKLSGLQDRAATTQESVSTRMSNFGSRMEEKLEKFGEGLAKSGEEIDRRNREPGEPLPEPLPLDKVDHMPNPKNLDDALPGTGFKDQQRNTPITDRKGGGAFPG